LAISCSLLARKKTASKAGVLASSPTTMVRKGLTGLLAPGRRHCKGARCSRQIQRQRLFTRGAEGGRSGRTRGHGKEKRHDALDDQELESQDHEGKFARLSPTTSRSEIVAQSAFNFRDNGFDLNPF
jgi:hypothetical protein